MAYNLFRMKHLLVMVLVLQSRGKQNQAWPSPKTLGPYTILPGIYSTESNRLETVLPTEFIGDVNITVSVILSSLDGTLLYLSHLGFVVLTLTELPAPTLTLEQEKLRQTISLDSLCNCRTNCKYEILNLSIEISSDIRLQCNKKSQIWIKKSSRRIGINQDGLQSTLWLFDRPPELDVRACKARLDGCLLWVTAGDRGQRLSLRPKGSLVQLGCLSSSCELQQRCSARPGLCVERFSRPFLCNCTAVFQFGPRCDNSFRSGFMKTAEFSRKFVGLKISWSHQNDQIMELQQRYSKLKLYQESGCLNLEYSYKNRRTWILLDRLIQRYSGSNENTVILRFNKSEMTIYIPSLNLSYRYQLPQYSTMDMYSKLIIYNNKYSSGLSDAAFKYSWHEIQWFPILWNFSLPHKSHQNTNEVTSSQLNKEQISMKLYLIFLVILAVGLIVFIIFMGSKILCRNSNDLGSPQETNRHCSSIDSGIQSILG